MLTVIASESYASFVDSLQKQTEAILSSRPRTATMAYFHGKCIRLDDGNIVKIDESQARALYNYLVRNGYVDDDGHITEQYRNDTEKGLCKALPESLTALTEGMHTLVQSIYDDSIFKKMITDGTKPKVLENPLNDRFYKEEFQKLWHEINHNYAYTVTFDSQELVDKSIDAINKELSVSPLQYTVTRASQKEHLNADMIREGESFTDTTTSTSKLAHSSPSRIAYDLVGKIAEGTILTRKTVAAILHGIHPLKFGMYKTNPEAFISKTIKIIRAQKATMVVDKITYNTIGRTYDSNIFTADKHALEMSKVYEARKAVQAYVFTDGTAENSVERRFAESLDAAEEVFIYAKLPRGFFIPTPFGHYTPDWAIVFHTGKVKYIYFIAETKGSMESMELRPIERKKIECAEKLFDQLSNGIVHYSHVDSFQELLNKVM